MKPWIILSMFLTCGCLNCTAESTSKEIGGTGGKLETGGASVVFPEGAFSGVSKINLKKIHRPFIKLPQKEALISNFFVLESEDLVFEKPVEMTLPYKSKINIEENHAYIAYNNGEGWVKLGNSKINKSNNTITASIMHTGEYCVLYREKKYGITVHPYKNTQVPILLVQDVVMPSEGFNPMIKYLKKNYSKHPIWLFEYPCNQPIEFSAKLLSDELKNLHKKYGDFKINIIGYGIGGLVSFYYMLDDSVCNNDIEKILITIGTPHKGSNLATCEDILSGVKQLESMGIKLTQSDINIAFSLCDAMGETGKTIQAKEDNPFLNKLGGLFAEYRQKSNSLSRYRKGPSLKIRIECFSGSNPYNFSKDYGAVLGNVKEVKKGFGDTYVAVANTMLSFIENTPFPVEHYALIRNKNVFSDIVGYLEIESFSWMDLFENIAKPDGMKKIVETWEQEYKLNQGDPINFKIILEFARNLLNSCEKDAILFTNGDNDTYPLWWLQEKEGFRKDVTVANLPLLNTFCFIKYLKGEPHKAPISFSDEEIDSLRPIGKKDGIIFVSYQIVDNILLSNEWKRPVYYSTTVSSDYLKHPAKLEGIVRRIVKEKGEEVDIEKCVKNLYETYTYNEIFDKQGNLVNGIDWMMNNMLTNYSGAYFAVGEALAKRGEKAEALKQFKRALDFASQNNTVVFPEANQLLVSVAKQYEDMGESKLAEKYFERAIELDSNFFPAYEALASLHKKAGDSARAVKVLSKWILIHPEDKGAVKLLGSYGE